MSDSQFGDPVASFNAKPPQQAAVEILSTLSASGADDKYAKMAQMLRKEMVLGRLPVSRFTEIFQVLLAMSAEDRDAGEFIEALRVEIPLIR